MKPLSYDHQKSFFLVRLRPGKDVFLLAFLVLVILTAVSAAQDRAVLFREDFDTLDNWKPYYFPRIKQHTLYSIEKNGSESVLRAESNASASAIVYKDSYNIVDYPKACWRWKVKNIYTKADPRAKAGDDYPIQIFIMFEYDPKKAGFGERVLFGLAKARFGEYPPHSSLRYVWASKAERERILSSPYMDRAKVIFLRMGATDAGSWREEDVNVLDDYRKAFRSEPPPRARIAIMNDSDNTGESSVSWVDYIEVYK